MQLARRLSAAVNAHDLDAVVDCFTEDYVNETPAHPARGFRGRAQVRRNWAQILAGVPDITATVLRVDRVGDVEWSEWEMQGNRVDGTQHLMRGVMVFGVEGDRATSVRFYLEPVDSASSTADDAVRDLVHRGPS
jgi:ketosteroid isomerase-like protein